MTRVVAYGGRAAKPQASGALWLAMLGLTTIAGSKHRPRNGLLSEIFVVFFFFFFFFFFYGMHL